MNGMFIAQTSNTVLMLLKLWELWRLVHPWWQRGCFHFQAQWLWYWYCCYHQVFGGEKHCVCSWTCQSSGDFRRCCHVSLVTNGIVTGCGTSTNTSPFISPRTPSAHCIDNPATQFNLSCTPANPYQDLILSYNKEIQELRLTWMEKFILPCQMPSVPIESGCWHQRLPIVMGGWVHCCLVVHVIEMLAKCQQNVQTSKIFQKLCHFATFCLKQTQNLPVKPVLGGEWRTDPPLQM